MFADAIWIIYINLLPNQIKNNIQTVMMITAGNFQMITNIFSKLFTISPDPTVATPSIWACGNACALHDYCGGFIFDKTSVRNPSNFNLSNNTKSSLKLVVVVFNSYSKTFHKRNLWERKNPVASCFWQARIQGGGIWGMCPPLEPNAQRKNLRRLKDLRGPIQRKSPKFSK